MVTLDNFFKMPLSYTARLSKIRRPAEKKRTAALRPQPVRVSEHRDSQIGSLADDGRDTILALSEFQPTAHEFFAGFRKQSLHPGQYEPAGADSVETIGLEPTTPGLQSRCSPN